MLCFGSTAGFSFYFLLFCVAPSRPACRRQLEAEVRDGEPVLLPGGRGSGPLHQRGLPHGGRHSGDVQEDVQRGRGVKGAEWVKSTKKKKSLGVKMSRFGGYWFPDDDSITCILCINWYKKWMLLWFHPPITWRCSWCLTHHFVLIYPNFVLLYFVSLRSLLGFKINIQHGLNFFLLHSMYLLSFVNQWVSEV